jgi:release factor glutamine methyltransferase
MNANLPPKQSINDWLSEATKALVFADIPSARLDSELILSHTLRRPRSYLHAHGDEELSPRDEEIASARLTLRLDRVPVAYIIGHKEFYGRRFRVTTATLIPRPESETLIELLKRALPANASLLSETLRLVDVGTGSGILGITAKLEYPELEVTLIDTSRHALRVAENNARQHHVDVELLRSHLLTAYPFEANIIISNLPYVDPAWERSPETRHEPAEALFSSHGGKALIYELIEQTKEKLALGGWLILEADPEQHADLTARAKKTGLVPVETLGYGLLFQKLS